LRCSLRIRRCEQRPSWSRKPLKRSPIGVLGWILLGLIAGAEAIHRGPDPGGLLATIVVGILGAIVGGLIASAVGLGGIGGFFDLRTWLTAVAGASSCSSPIGAW
jgi:uncharacterized membrane protein YeaQ/YmgE (transglycosylase-associated protein family)